MPQSELSWRRMEDPAQIFEVGQLVEVEVIGVDWRRKHVMLSAKACEDRTLRTFLVGIERGEILTGTVADIHNFGVFVNLDGEPANHCTGFIQIPQLSWKYFDHASDVVELGQRVTVKVLDSSTRRGQVSLSLKALQDDPFIPLADHVGDAVTGHITKLVPFGAFVRVADGIEGLLHVSDLSDEPAESLDGLFHEGEEITVRISEVDLEHHRVRLHFVNKA
ncbi:small subunit ribosomal protein S1 [Thermomonospora umbrina]|uniref:Small subunit ribosomal protein S1 n=1 Tax=Thermomonospora umbrina TaxID=111806 RepID=A0A3D9SM79_9ACTN|nr:small subunit ribosomal protein S1 [Thermomonospora umbrina]